MDHLTGSSPSTFANQVPQLPLVRLRVEHSGPWPWYEREHRAGYVTKRLTHL